MRANTLKPVFILLICALALWLFYAYHSCPLDYDTCPLCDKHQYTKLYEFFKSDESSQIKFPFYQRPLIPFIAASLPTSGLWSSFYWVNLFFFLGSCIALLVLWNHLQIKWPVMVLGFGWLMIHWTGIIRYNLMDYVTVDVPMYFFQAGALLLFLWKKFRWFYLLVPLAILQKESFIPVMVVLIVVTLSTGLNTQWWDKSKHLILSLILGILVQKLWIWYFPEQMDQRSSVMALLYHGKLLAMDPSRLIRWFAAFGSDFGVLPLLAVYTFRIQRLSDPIYLALIGLSLLFMAFGLFAGEDMTRIMFLGFPFIMTLILCELKSLNRWIVLVAIALSLPSLRLYPLYADVAWAVDYADLSYVYPWAAYYLVAGLMLTIIYFAQKRHWS